MFAKVANRVRRRSAAGQRLSTTVTQSQEAVIQVDIAPELLRWADFSTPFPSVSLGGYSRFYEKQAPSEPMEPPLRFCPLLSQQPEPSPSSEIPSKSPLFNTLRRKCLPVIREVSLDSLTLNVKPRDLTITTSTTTQPHSLKRRQKQLFRSPSIESDFALSGCQSLSEASETSITINHNVSTDATPTDTPPSPTSSIFSSDSRLSRKRSDSNYSEFPITPATSVEDEIPLLPTELLDKELSSSTPHIEESGESESEPVMTGPISPSSCCTVKILPGHCHNNESESAVTRPLSSLSYCTATSDFGEI